MITALKQLYENHYTKDLAALKKVYEQHAEDCVQAANLTADQGRREVYLKLARQWTEAAAALQATAIVSKNRANPAQAYEGSRAPHSPNN